MAVPKRKVSHARKNTRRAQAFKLEVPGFSKCPHCHNFKLPHRVCKVCGFYKGREVIPMSAE